MINTKLDKFKDCKILVVGDVMLDEYIWGDTTRISPEAPVPIVLAQEQSFTLGGAANVAANIANLGAKVTIAGITGRDTNRDKLLKMFRQLNINTCGLLDDISRFTTVKTRIFASNQQVLRIDREETEDISETYSLRLLKIIKERINSFDAVILSDYGKGVLGKDFTTKLINVANIHGKFILVDPKGSNFLKYYGSALITPNLKELSLVADFEIKDMNSLEKIGESVRANTSLEGLLVTCGKDGMVLFEPRKDSFYIKAEAKDIFDVSGAGDTVIAVFALAISAGFTFRGAAMLANKAAGIVVGKVGTATLSLDELRNNLEKPLTNRP